MKSCSFPLFLKDKQNSCNLFRGNVLDFTNWYNWEKKKTNTFWTTEGHLEFPQVDTSSCAFPHKFLINHMWVYTNKLWLLVQQTTVQREQHLPRFLKSMEIQSWQLLPISVLCANKVHVLWVIPWRIFSKHELIHQFHALLQRQQRRSNLCTMLCHSAVPATLMSAHFSFKQKLCLMLKTNWKHKNLIVYNTDNIILVVAAADTKWLME